MFPEFFQNSSRIPLSSVPLTGEFAEYTITVIFVLYFISFILLKYFLTFPVRILSLEQTAVEFFKNSEQNSAFKSSRLRPKVKKPIQSGRESTQFLAAANSFWKS